MSNGTSSSFPASRSVPLSSSSSAPWYDVPVLSLVSVEHPYIIRNIDKGISSLGGLSKLDELVREDNDDTPTASLYQRPGNRLTKALYSHNVQTSNVVLKITVPKRTGLKRKRGSNEPFSEGSIHETARRPVSMTGDTIYLLHSLQENSQNNQVEAIGTISQTHRFRTLPDFAQSSTSSPFMQKMKDNVLPFEYANLKEFRLDMAKGVQPNGEIIPPPIWSHHTIPINYAYRQNPGVISTTDAQGNMTTRNTQLPPKIRAQPIPFDAPSVPTAPPAGLPPVSSLDPALQHLIATAHALLESRPIFTRRSLPNCIPGDKWQSVGQNVTKFLYQYIGYIFASGPWRDAIVKFGVDPRKDPACRSYQTMMFVIDSEPKDSRAKRSRARPKREKTEQEVRKESHLFDGVNISQDGKVWQVCDVTDPFLKDLLATENLRTQCHLESDGWYHNGTWAKVKTIMKWKITAILSGSELLTDSNYARVAADTPDILRRAGKSAMRLTYENATAEERLLASQIRSASTLYRLDGDDRRAVRDSYAGLEDELEGEGRGDLHEEDTSQEMEGESGGEAMGWDARPMESVIDPNLEDARVHEAMREIDRLGGGLMPDDGFDEDAANEER